MSYNKDNNVAEAVLRDNKNINNSNPSIYERFQSHFDTLGVAFGINGKVVAIIILLIVVSVFIGFFDVYLTVLVGIVYPSYFSIKALETQELDDDKHWLTYWVVFGLLILLDTFLKIILDYIPFYITVKLLFILWLFLPNFKGALIIYHNFIIKCFKKYEKQIDLAKDNFEEKLNSGLHAEREFFSKNEDKFYQESLGIAARLNQKVAQTNK